MVYIYMNVLPLEVHVCCVNHWTCQNPIIIDNVTFKILVTQLPTLPLLHSATVRLVAVLSADMTPLPMFIVVKHGTCMA